MRSGVIAMAILAGGVATADVGKDGAVVDSTRGAEMVFVEWAQGDFYIDKYETTNEEYAAFLNARGNEKIEGGYWVELGSQYATIEEGEGGYAAKEGFARHPVVEVSWHGAMAYCAWAGKRLPTQEEWRFACEGVERRKYPWGDGYELGRANIAGDKDGYVRTAPVGSFPLGATPLGIMDLGANVWEWTRGEGEMQLLWGGSWVNGYILAQCGKRANTKNSHSYIKGNMMGFRCVR